MVETHTKIKIDDAALPISASLALSHISVPDLHSDTVIGVIRSPLTNVFADFSTVSGRISDTSIPRASSDIISRPQVNLATASGSLLSHIYGYQNNASISLSRLTQMNSRLIDLYGSGLNKSDLSFSRSYQSLVGGCAGFATTTLDAEIKKYLANSYVNSTFHGNYAVEVSSGGYSFILSWVQKISKEIRAARSYVTNLIVRKLESLKSLRVRRTQILLA